MRRAVTAVVAGLLLLTGCGSSAPDARNATYVIEGAAVRVAHGRSAVPAAPGSASQVVTEVVGSPAIGDLNGDGLPDAAVILAQSPGGSGTFYYLAVLLSRGAGQAPAATPAVFLGDRVVVRGLSVAGGILTVHMLVRTASQPMAAPPTRPVVRRYRVSMSLVPVAQGPSG